MFLSLASGYIIDEMGSCCGEKNHGLIPQILLLNFQLFNCHVLLKVGYDFMK